jgi:predicted dehydrogenase
MANNQTIRVGFIGAGANTRLHHIPKLKAQPGVELVSVANRSRESGERVAKEFGISRVHDNWRDVVQSPDVDAVCIGTWPYTHCEMTLAALDAGKHVLCEARMAMNAAEGRRMLEGSRRHPNLVTQLVPGPQTLELDSTIQELLAQGYAGDVLSVELQTSSRQFVQPDAPLHWRQNIALSGSNIFTMGIWYEAMMRWVGHARRVTAMTKIVVPRRRDETGAWHDVRVPDHVDILATMPSGAIARLRVSTVAALAPPTDAWIFGSEGTLRIEPEAKRVSGGRRGDKELKEIAIAPEKRIGWRVEEEFVNAIRGREKITRTNFEDGVRYMEFTDAVSKSATSGQTVDVKDL